MWNLEKLMDESVCRAEIENRHVSTEGVEGKMYWDTGTDLNTLPCVKLIAGGNLQYCAGSSAQCSTITWMGGMEGNGRTQICVYTELSHFIVEQILTHHCKATIFQVFKNRDKICSLVEFAAYGKVAKQIIE